MSDTKLRSNVVGLQEWMILEKSSNTKSGLAIPRSRRIVSNKALCALLLTHHASQTQQRNALAKVGLPQILLSNKGKS